MLQDYFEEFALLQATRIPDELGGVSTAWTESLVFRGAVTQVVSKEAAPSGLLAVKTLPVLLHEWDVTLRQGDIIRRVSDGAEYRVTGQSSDMRTPPVAATVYCQVPVERLVFAK